MVHFQLFIICFLLQIVSVFLFGTEIKNNNTSRVLSRKKRYLVFPEGSSFQLVYCLTMPTYGVGNIFTIGLTAALAWELPHEPIDLKKLKSGTNDAEKRIDHRNNQTKISFHNPFIQKYPHQYITNDWVKQTNKKHENYFGELLPAYRNEYLYRKHGQVHRRTRRELFAKIEKFFQAQDKDGRACLLKSICEVNQKKTSEKGSFVEEILKAIFTWVPGEENKMDHELFDEASGHKGNCTEKYPTCRQSVWNPFF